MPRVPRVPKRAQKWLKVPREPKIVKKCPECPKVPKMAKKCPEMPNLKNSNIKFFLGHPLLRGWAETETETSSKNKKLVPAQLGYKKYWHTGHNFRAESRKNIYSSCTFIQKVKGESQSERKVLNAFFPKDVAGMPVFLHPFRIGTKFGYCSKFRFRFLLNPYLKLPIALSIVCFCI